MGSSARRLAVGAMCLVSTWLAARSVLAGVSASGDDTLATARAWFAEALRDEDAGRFDDALAKFERVREVRDTAPVEYRLGTCYDGLAQPLSAYRAYRQAMTLGEHDADAAEVVQASRARVETLEKTIARLRIAFSAAAPAGVEVRVDGAVMDADAFVAPIPMVPGMHTVTASAKDRVPFRADVPLSAGADTWVTVVLAHGGERAGVASSESMAGWITFGGGGALVAASAILLVVRHDEIGALDRNCPGGVCRPGANRAELESTRSRALVEGPAAIGCGVAGAIALATGAVLVLRANHPLSSGAHESLELAPVIGLRGAGVVLGSSFR